jgi:hypothetical protein
VCVSADSRPDRILYRQTLLLRRKICVMDFKPPPGAPEPRLPSSPPPVRIHFNKERMINAKSVDEMRLRLEEDVTTVRPPKMRNVGSIKAPSSPKPVRVRYNQDELVNCRSVEELQKLIHEGVMDVRVPKSKAPDTPTPPSESNLKSKIVSCRSLKDLHSLIKNEKEEKEQEEAKTPSKKSTFERTKVPGAIAVKQQPRKTSRPAEAFTRTKMKSAPRTKPKKKGEAFSLSKFT